MTHKKKLLIYAQYYYPDVASTGQILQDQAEGMLNDFDVTVICAVPSYSGTIPPHYKDKRFYEEDINGVHVIRVRVPEFSKDNKISRIKNIITYFFHALVAAKRTGNQDYLFTISQPPVFGGLLGVCGKWMMRSTGGSSAKFIYCIQDFNPEQIIAVNYSKNKLLLSILMALDKFSCKQSDLIITVGRDLVETLKKRFAPNGKRPEKVPKHTLITNWIDEKAIYPLPSVHPKVVEFKEKYSLIGADGEKKFVIMYSGNIGLYYDLENLIKVMGKFQGITTPDSKEVVFAFVGAGVVLRKLENYVEQHKLGNIVFIPYQSMDDLIYSLNAGDVHWCVSAKGIKGVSCPSKFYGICGCRKPILGVLEKGSEIRYLLEESGCGLCSDPGDYMGVENNIKWYIEHSSDCVVETMGKNGYEYLMKYLRKDISIRKYVNAINGV